MKAGEVMTTGAATVRPDASLADAARIMLEHRISGLPVVDATGQLVGMVTERDFLRRDERDRPRWIDVLLKESSGQITAKQLNDRRVDQIMSPNPISVGVEAPIEEVIDLMESHGIKRIPVLADGRVVGIISRANLLLALTRKATRPSDWRK
jgi:CBS domain-containing protein